MHQQRKLLKSMINSVNPRYFQDLVQCLLWLTGSSAVKFEN